MVRTFCPISPKQEERLIAVVDLPTPPFWFAIAIVLPKICIASFHLFVFHLQFFLFTGNDLPALLSKKWFMRQVFWHIDRKNLLFYASLSEEFFRFYLKIAPIWDKDILSYYAGFYYWKCFTWNIFCIFAWLGGLKHKKLEIFGDVSRETFWKALFYNNFSRFLRCLKAFWNFFSDDFAFFDGFQVILQCQNIFSVSHSFYKMFHVKYFNFWRFWGINILETLF